jgi:hypothetical protein
MMLKGVQARFIDPETGSEVRPASATNQVSDYIMGALNAGLHLVDISEHLADAELAEQAERARKHVGWPLLLVMKPRPGETT